MAKGIIYICSTVVKGLIKIGKTTDFDGRMRKLEADGYHNVGGLKREFAIELENYSEKEDLIHRIFSKSQVDDSELFTLDMELVKQMLCSFEGTIIYPKGVNKEDIFAEATEAVEVAEEEAEEKKGRTTKPKLDWMIANGVVSAGDEVFYKQKPTEKAVIQANAKVKYNGKQMSLLDFARKMTGWEHVNAYRHMIVEGKGRTLLELREEKMKELGM